MCGILSYIAFSETPKSERVRRIFDVFTHRIADDYGLPIADVCAIGMRQLRIIDLSTGHQRIANEDESVWIFFNGEMYSVPELRANLESHGHRFRTRSDTGANLHLYKEYGLDGLPRLRGMFVLAIRDKERGETLLDRDQFGKKARYLTRNASGFYVGCELKCVRPDSLDFQGNEETFGWYFLLNHTSDPLTCHRELSKVLAAGGRRIDRNGRQTKGLYWNLRVPAAALPLNFRLDRILGQCLDNCARAGLLANVPLGAFLSGGVESKFVGPPRARRTRKSVKTFSSGLAESGYDATAEARESTSLYGYGTNHLEQIVASESIALTEKLVEFFDEPSADSSTVLTYVFSKVARRHVTVVSSCDGGEERFSDSIIFPPVVSRAWADHISQGLRRTVSTATELARMFAGFLPATLGGHLAEAMSFEVTAKLTDDILTKVDRASMANSLEALCPLLGHTLTELAVPLPLDRKPAVGRGKQRRISALFDAPLSRPQKRSSVSPQEWFRGVLNGYLWDYLNSWSSHHHGIVDQPFPQQIPPEHEFLRRDNSHWLRAPLMAELLFFPYEQDPHTA